MGVELLTPASPGTVDPPSPKLLDEPLARSKAVRRDNYGVWMRWTGSGEPVHDRVNKVDWTRCTEADAIVQEPLLSMFMTYNRARKYLLGRLEEPCHTPYNLDIRNWLETLETLGTLLRDLDARITSLTNPWYCFYYRPAHLLDVFDRIDKELIDMSWIKPTLHHDSDAKGIINDRNRRLEDLTIALKTVMDSAYSSEQIWNQENNKSGPSPEAHIQGLDQLSLGTESRHSGSTTLHSSGAGTDELSKTVLHSETLGISLAHHQPSDKHTNETGPWIDSPETFRAMEALSSQRGRGIKAPGNDGEILHGNPGLNVSLLDTGDNSPIVGKRHSDPATVASQYNIERNQSKQSNSHQLKDSKVPLHLKFSCDFPGCRESFIQKDQLNDHQEIHRVLTEQPVVASTIVDEQGHPRQRLPSSDPYAVETELGGKQESEAFAKEFQVVDLAHDIMEHAQDELPHTGSHEPTKFMNAEQAVNKVSLEQQPRIRLERGSTTETQETVSYQFSPVSKQEDNVAQREMGNSTQIAQPDSTADFIPPDHNLDDTEQHVVEIATKLNKISGQDSLWRCATKIWLGLTRPRVRPGYRRLSWRCVSFICLLNILDTNGSRNVEKSCTMTSTTVLHMPST